VFTARYVLPTQCINVFCVDLRTNSDYFSIQLDVGGGGEQSFSLLGISQISSTCLSD
jgi:hypothetical protein